MLCWLRMTKRSVLECGTSLQRSSAFAGARGPSIIYWLQEAFPERETFPPALRGRDDHQTAAIAQCYNGSCMADTGDIPRYPRHIVDE